MQAIEFMTATQDGIIQIPPVYKDWFSTSVRVILLSGLESEISQNDNSDDTPLHHFFDQFNADLTEYEFNREETHVQ